MDDHHHMSETHSNSPPLPASIEQQRHCTSTFGNDCGDEQVARCGAKAIDCLCMVLPLSAVKAKTVHTTTPPVPLEWCAEDQDGVASSTLIETHVHTPPQPDMAGGAWPYAPGTSRASIPRTSSALDFDAPSGSGTSAAQSPRAHDLDEIVGALQALQHNDHKYLMSVIRAHVDELFAVSTDPSVISDRLAILEQRVLQSSDISVNLGPLFAVVRAEHSLPRSPLFPDEAVTPSPTHATLPDPYSRSSSAPAESHHQYHYAPHGSMGPPPLSRPHTQPRPRRLQTDIMPSHWTFPPPAPHPRPPSSKRPRAGEEQRYATTPAPARRPRPSLSFGQAARSYPPAGGRVFGLGIPPASATSPTEMNERLQAIEDEYRRAQGANEVEMLEEVPDIGPSSR